MPLDTLVTDGLHSTGLVNGRSVSLLPPDGIEASASSVLNTTEVRWFGTGALPLSLVEWFSASGELGFQRERSDAYRASSAHAVGMKCRNHGCLEMKVRRRISGPIRLAGGIDGRVEEWSKFRPTRSRARFSGSGSWTEVRKAMVIRRFAVESGGTFPVDRGVKPSLGCDIELTSILVEGISAWTFALEAHGRPTARLGALRAAWDAMQQDTPLPDDLASRLEHNLGYPGWLNTFVWGAGGVAAR